MIVNRSEVREELEKLERKHAENPEGRYFVPLANAYRKIGDVDRAVDVLRTGLEKHPDYLSAHIVLGRCLADMADTAAAESEFRYVLSLDSQNLIALRTLGELALSDGRIDDARRWYSELLAVDPMNEDARRALEGIQVIPQAPAELSPEADAEVVTLPTIGEAAGSPSSEEVGQFDALFGDSALSGGDQDDEETYAGEGPGVVTETIAELYTRQGFYDRAAEVYRELLKRRGPNAELEERLRRVESLAAGEEEEPSVRTVSGRAPDSEDELVLAAYDEMALTAEDELQPATREELTTPADDHFPADEEPRPHGDPMRESAGLAPRQWEEEEEQAAADQFAASFTAGFPDSIATDQKLEAEETGAADELPMLTEYGMRQLEASTPVGTVAAGVEETAGETIADYLQSVLSWKPAGRTSSEPAAGAAPAAPSPGPRPEPAPEPSSPVSEPPSPAPSRSTPVPAATQETPSRPADADLFPWELPEERPESTPAAEVSRSGGPPEPADAPRAAAPPEAAADAPRSATPPQPTAEPTRGEQPPEPASEPPTEPTPEPETPAASAEEDLESFQAWLRSLKR